MECANFVRDNPLDAVYCGECGERLHGDARVVTAIKRESGTLQPGTTYAGFWIRFLAWIIDLVIVGTLSALLTIWAFFSYYLFPNNFIYMTVYILFVFVFPALYYVLLTGLRGQTLGKMTLGIRVVGPDRRVPGLKYAALREVVGKFLSVNALFLGFLWISWDREKRGWHDMIAKTHVVKKSRGGANIDY